MKSKASPWIVRALEEEGARFTFGIPGTHNIDLYDALEDSSLEPVLVTDEQSASFMADAVSRTSESVGVVNVVPGAGVTHALSGIAEAWMDHVPMVVLACGIRSDTGRAFQLHAIDQVAVLRPVVKEVFQPKTIGEIYTRVREAFRLARSGCPGPVAVEIPAEFYFVAQAFVEPAPPRDPGPLSVDMEAVAKAARILGESKNPILYAGRGAAAAFPEIEALAEKLEAPVATTIQGKGVLREDHPLWMWNGLGRSAPPFVQAIEKEADAMLAIGCRFGEVATASYGFTPPPDLIHVDIDAGALDRNFQARLAVASDAKVFLTALLERVKQRPVQAKVRAAIRDGHAAVREHQRKPSEGKVTPAALFDVLQEKAGEDAVFSADSGNGTFLAMEHLRLGAPNRLIAPVDYSCMGYAVPAALGAKIARPERDSIALAGDGALLMTGLELLSAKGRPSAPLVCVLRDGELGQIVQFQRTALNRDTCSVLEDYRVEDYAKFTGAAFARVETDADLEAAVEQGLQGAREGRAAVLEINIDYSRKTYFTKGVVKTNFLRMPWGDRLRTVGRLLKRKAGIAK